jgi:hypothetical protein
MEKRKILSLPRNELIRNTYKSISEIILTNDAKGARRISQVQNQQKQGEVLLPDDGGDTFLRNTGTSTNYTALKPRRLHF